MEGEGSWEEVGAEQEQERFWGVWVQTFAQRNEHVLQQHPEVEELSL
jgi:hypothetical protein